MDQRQTFLTRGEKHHRHHRHWHYVYKRRTQKPISWKEIALGQIIALSGSLVAGLLLDINKHTLSLFAGAFLLLPGVIDLAASITGAMCAKINHRLETSDQTWRIVRGSVAFALLLSLMSGLVVGVSGGIIGTFFFDASFWQICGLCVATMVAVGLVTYPIMSTLTVVIRRTGVDPDNVIGPVETGFTDMLTVTMVALLVRLFV
jgi:cation transporter-like permease